MMLHLLRRQPAHMQVHRRRPISDQAMLITQYREDGKACLGVARLYLIIPRCKSDGEQKTFLCTSRYSLHSEIDSDLTATTSAAGFLSIAVMSTPPDGPAELEGSSELDSRSEGDDMCLAFGFMSGQWPCFSKYRMLQKTMMTAIQ